MIFTSFRFLAFFAAAAGICFLVPRRWRWVWLLIASLGFYLAAGPKFILYLLFTALTVWAAACGIDRIVQEEEDEDRAGRRSGWLLAACVVLNLGILAVLKYLGFGLRILDVCSGGRLRFAAPALVLPLGISFYTFQSIGYLVDVRRGVVRAEKNPLVVLLFLSFFPCVAQGPINRFGDLTPQLLAGAELSAERTARGAQRMLWGFFEKLVIADRLGILVDGVFADLSAHAGWQLVLAVALYAFQIYADFQGYMDIACGCGEIVGVTVPENFRAPYLSATVPEFWRRWHITLGSWFRDYVYYPVQRSALFSRIREKTCDKPRARRVDRLLTVIALFVVWGLTGLWHGAGAAYVLWGLYYGLLISLSTVCTPRGKRKKRRGVLRALQTVRTFALVLLGYVFFRSRSLEQIAEFFRVLAHRAAEPAPFALGAPDLWAAGVSLALLIAVDALHAAGFDLRSRIGARPLPLRWALWLGLLGAIVLFGVYGPGFDAASFLYFKY